MCVHVRVCDKCYPSPQEPKEKTKVRGRDLLHFRGRTETLRKRNWGKPFLWTSKGAKALIPNCCHLLAEQIQKWGKKFDEKIWSQEKSGVMVRRLGDGRCNDFWSFLKWFTR